MTQGDVFHEFARPVYVVGGILPPTMDRILRRLILVAPFSSLSKRAHTHGLLYYVGITIVLLSYYCCIIIADVYVYARQVRQTTGQKFRLHCMQGCACVPVCVHACLCVHCKLQKFTSQASDWDETLPECREKCSAHVCKYQAARKLTKNI